MAAKRSTALWKKTTAITRDVAKECISLTKFLGGNAITVR
jgi:hypothetical protein